MRPFAAPWLESEGAAPCIAGQACKSPQVMAYARFDHRPASLLPALAAEVRRKLPRFSPQVRARDASFSRHRPLIDSQVQHE